MPQMAVGSDHTPFIVDPGRVAQLCRELKVVGVELPRGRDRDGGLTADVGLTVDALAVHTSAAAAALFKQQLFDALTSGSPLLVSLRHVNSADSARDVFSDACECIHDVALEVGIKPADIGVAVEASALSPQAAWSLRCEALDDGPLFLLPGHALMCPDATPPARSRHDRFWLQMWHLRRTLLLRPAYAPMVSSQCPLLCDEAADSILPTSAIQVPAGSAWLTLRLDLARFADATGSLHGHSLEHALCRAVEVGEELHEQMVWPNAQMRHDAWLNRRLAIVVSGFGDLLRLQALDPCDFSALQSLSATVVSLQETLLQQSRRIAKRRGVLPALRQADPSHGLPGGQVRNGWRKRWRRAMQQAAIRHRNILVLSPWSVFPAADAADIRYANLLPLLGFADACSFSDAPNLQDWNLNQFKSFHQRAWAVLQQREHARQIAEGI